MEIIFYDELFAFGALCYHTMIAFFFCPAPSSFFSFLFRPKSYAYLTSKAGEEVKKAKGIGRAVTKNEITFEDYQRVLETTLPQRHAMNTIRSKDHNLYIQKLEKTSLSLFEDKRYWLSHYVSVPYGHPLTMTRP